MVFQKGHKGFARKKKVLAQMGANSITYDDIVEEEIKKDNNSDGIQRKRFGDEISDALGTAFFIQNRREPWHVDIIGNQIIFSRYYPAKKLYIDFFRDDLTEEEVNFRKALVEANGCQYYAFEQEKPFDITKIKL